MSQSVAGTTVVNRLSRVGFQHAGLRGSNCVLEDRRARSRSSASVDDNERRGVAEVLKARAETGIVPTVSGRRHVDA
jgi:hypothetical protein